MPIYTCEIIGSGSENDPIRLPYYDDHDHRIGGIILAAPGSKDGVGILYLPEEVQDVKLQHIGDIHHERCASHVRNNLQNRLGITCRAHSHASVADIIAEVMQEHGESNHKQNRKKWGTLLPSKYRQQYEIHLGSLGIIWTAPAPPTPATQTFTESWPSAGAITSGQNQTWTNVVNTLTVAGGVVQFGSSNIGIARCESVLDTSDQYHQATFALVDGGANSNAVSVYVRFADNSNWYRVIGIRRSGVSHLRGELTKRVTGADTVLIAGDSTDPGASGTIKVTLSGSTVTSDCGAYNSSATDGSPALLTNFKGGILCQAVTGISTDATLDAHTIADVVAAVVNPFVNIDFNVNIAAKQKAQQFVIARNFNLYPPPLPFVTQIGGKRIVY